MRDLVKYLYRLLELFSGIVFLSSFTGWLYKSSKGEMDEYIRFFFFIQEALFEYCVTIFCIALALDIVSQNFIRLVRLMDEYSLSNFRYSLMYAGFASVLALIMYSLAYGIPSMKLLFWIPFSTFLNVFAIVELIRSVVKDEIYKRWDKPDKVKENALELSQKAHESKREGD